MHCSYEEFKSGMALTTTLPACLDAAAAGEFIASSTGPAWDLFYAREVDPYKPRRYLSAEFPELLSKPDGALLFDVGCGYGSALLPLLRENPTLRAVACDLSPTAIDKLRVSLAASAPTPSRVSAHVLVHHTANHSWTWRKP